MLLASMVDMWLIFAKSHYWSAEQCSSSRQVHLTYDHFINLHAIPGIAENPRIQEESNPL